MSVVEYKASACGPGCEESLDHGVLWISGEGISFRGAATLFTLPLEGVKVDRAGATGDTMRFSHPAHPGWFISTTNLAVLSDPVLRGQGSLRSSLKTGRRRGLCCLGGCVTMIVLVVALVAGLVMAKDAIVQGLANHFPPELEQKLGNVLAEGIAPASQRLTEPELVAYLDAIANPVLKAIPKEEGFTSFTVHLVRADEPNAFAIPGGHIVVNTGLIKLADTPEQVAGVLAHEAGHATMRHSLQSVISQLGVAAVLQVLAGDMQGLGGIMVEGGQFLLTQKYSRDFERQADEKAWQYLMAAKVNPRGLVEFFEKIEKLQGGAVQPEMLSTHPDTRQRMADLEKRLQALPADQQWRKLELDFAEFKRRVEQK